jgi:hypothetical protein
VARELAPARLRSSRKTGRCGLPEEKSKAKQQDETTKRITTGVIALVSTVAVTSIFS